MFCHIINRFLTRTRNIVHFGVTLNMLFTYLHTVFCVYMYIQLDTIIHTYTFNIRTCIYTDIHIYIHTYTCIHKHIHTYIYVHYTCTYTYLHMYTYPWYLHVNINIYIYIYTYIYAYPYMCTIIHYYKHGRLYITSRQVLVYYEWSLRNVAYSDILLQEIIFILLLFQFGHPQFQFYFNYSS